MVSKKQFRIRRATESDASDIWEIGSKVFRGLLMEDWSLLEIAEYLEEYPGFSFVAVREGELVGFILGKPWEDESTKFYIGWVAVVPKARGQGIGTALIEKIADIATKEGFKSILIDTQKRNVTMQKLLEQANFSPVEEEVYFIRKLKKPKKVKKK